MLQELQIMGELLNYAHNTIHNISHWNISYRVTWPPFEWWLAGSLRSDWLPAAPRLSSLGVWWFG